MKRVAISQRVIADPVHGQRRDALDQQWIPLLEAAGCMPVPLPNRLRDVAGFCRDLKVEALLLTGGNDLAHLATPDAAPERDATETAALEHAVAHRLPVLGVCRGMQLLVCRFGGRLHEVAHHAGTTHALHGDLGPYGSLPAHVGSFHRWGVLRQDVVDPMQVLATSDDGVVEAVRHLRLPILGVMWHPEREADGASAERLVRTALGISTNGAA